MTKKYLLPCVCGSVCEVEPAQAGQTVSCRCGRPVEVPTLLELRKLPLASEESVSPPVSGWGVRHRLMTVGGLIVLGGAAWLGILALLWPEKPQVPETITWQTPPPPGQKKPLRKTTEELTLLESYLAWESLPRQLELLSDAPMTRYKKDLATARNWLTVGLVVVLLGGVCVGSGWLLVPTYPAGRHLTPGSAKKPPGR